MATARPAREYQQAYEELELAAERFDGRRDVASTVVEHCYSENAMADHGTLDDQDPSLIRFLYNTKPRET